MAILISRMVKILPPYAIIIFYNTGRSAGQTEASKPSNVGSIPARSALSGMYGFDKKLEHDVTGLEKTSKFLGRGFDTTISTRVLHTFYS